MINCSMKKTIIAIIFIALHFTVYAQEIEYGQLNNVHYYPEPINKGDSYINNMCVLDVYYPKGRKNFSTVVWFHGGGLTGGKKEIPAALKGKGICIVGVGYRLSPKVKSPDFISDAAAAVSWTFKNISGWGGDTSLIFVSGHSAGAYLASMITLDKSWLSKYNIEANRIAGLISISSQAITHFTIRKERGLAETKVVVDSLAPLNFVRADAPPTLLITGDREQELLGRYEENAYWYRMMKLAGHKDVRLLELQGFDHGGMVEPALTLLVKEVMRVLKTKNIPN